MNREDELRKLAAKIYTKYCIQDTILPIELIEMDNAVIGIQETANVCGIDFMETYTRGQGVRVAASEYIYMRGSDYILDESTVEHEKYKGGFVEKPLQGMHILVYILDFASLYPSIMRRYNMCLTTLVRDMGRAGKDKNIKDDDCYVFDFVEDDIRYYHRFIKEEVHKGVLPSILSDQFTKRKAVKWEMFKIDDSIDNLQNLIQLDFEKLSLLIQPYLDKLKKYNVPEVMEILSVLDWNDYDSFKLFCTRVKEIIPGMKVNVNVLDSRQKALKVAMNSIYGDKGASTSKGKCVPITRCVCHAGRSGIIESGEIISEVFNSYVVYGDTDSVMMSCSWVDDKLIEIEKKRRESDKFRAKVRESMMNIPIWRERFEESGESVFNEYLTQKITKVKDNFIVNLGKKMESYLNDNVFKAPMKMEFENIYLIMGNLSKKMYFYVRSDLDAPLVLKLKNFGSKGLVIVKRDRNPYLKKSYDHMCKILTVCYYFNMYKAFSDRTEPTLVDLKTNYPVYYDIVQEYLSGTTVKEILLRELNEICRKIRDNEVKVSDLEVGTRLSGQWKSETYRLSVFYDYLKSRGQNVKPGDRVNFIVVQDKADPKAKIGAKMRTTPLYIEDKKAGLFSEIDNDYYIGSMKKFFYDLLTKCCPEIKAEEVNTIFSSYSTRYKYK